MEDDIIGNIFPKEHSGWCLEKGLERAKTEERGAYFGGRSGIIAGRLDIVPEEKREIKSDPQVLA